MCWKCGQEIEESGRIGRGDVCSVCGSDLRACKNCLRYAPGGYHDCSERVEDAPTDKERANFCDFFSLRRNFAGKAGADEDARKAARAAFDSLFS